MDGVDRMHRLRDIRVKLYCDLEIGFRVIQGHRKRHYSIERIQLYIRLPCLYLLLFPRYSRIFVVSKIATPLYLAPRWPQICARTLKDEKLE